MKILFFYPNNSNAIHFHLLKSHRVNLINKGLPLGWEDNFGEVLFLFVRDGGVTNTVKRNLLEVTQVQLPSNGGHGVVKSDTFVIEESWVIATDRELQAFEHQVTNWVLLQVEGVTKYQVRQGANFNAHVFLNELVNEVRELENLETVTNTLTVQQQTAVKIMHFTIVSFTSVAESRHAECG